MTRDRAHKKAIRARMAARGEPYSVAARKLATPATPADPETPAEPDTAAVRDVLTRTTATLAAPGAWFEFRTDWALLEPWPARPSPGLIGRLARRAARAALERIAPGEIPASLADWFAHSAGTGILEPAAARYQIDYGHYAETYIDGKEFGGRSGTQVQAPHRNRRAPETDTPLTLLRRPQGATDARHIGDETLRGTPCRMMTVTTPDLARLTVWIDDEHIRQIQREERAEKISRTWTLELWDFGVPVDSLDWSRLPTFRTPS